MERLVVELFKVGKTDRQIARRLTELGHRSPQKSYAVRSTVKTIRYKHGLIRGARVKGASRAHHVPGLLTLSQVAHKLEVPKPWIYNRIYNGAIRVVKNDRTVSVPRHSGHHREVPGVEGRQGLQTSVLKGHQHARSYNRRRLHSALSYQSPISYEEATMEGAAVA